MRNTLLGPPAPRWRLLPLLRRQARAEQHRVSAIAAHHGHCRRALHRSALSHDWPEHVIISTPDLVMAEGTGLSENLGPASDGASFYELYYSPSDLLAAPCRRFDRVGVVLFFGAD